MNRDARPSRVTGEDSRAKSWVCVFDKWVADVVSGPFCVGSAAGGVSHWRGNWLAGARLRCSWRCIAVREPADPSETRVPRCDVLSGAPCRGSSRLEKAQKARFGWDCLSRQKAPGVAWTYSLNPSACVRLWPVRCAASKARYRFAGSVRPALYGAAAVFGGMRGRCQTGDSRCQKPGVVVSVPGTED